MHCPESLCFIISICIHIRRLSLSDCNAWPKPDENVRPVGYARDAGRVPT